MISTILYFVLWGLFVGYLMTGNETLLVILFGIIASILAIMLCEKYEKICKGKTYVVSYDLYIETEVGVSHRRGTYTSGLSSIDKVLNKMREDLGGIIVVRHIYKE